MKNKRLLRSSFLLPVSIDQATQRAAMLAQQLCWCTSSLAAKAAELSVSKQVVFSYKNLLGNPVGPSVNRRSRS